MNIATVIANTKVQFTFKVGFPTAPIHSVLIEDISALGLTGTEEAKFLFKITSPSGTVIYKNAGYDAGTYTTTNVGYSATSNLPLTTSGLPEEGKYKVEIKVRYTDDNTAGSPTYTYSTKTILTSELCMCDLKTVSINHTYDIDAMTFTSKDTTSYNGSLTYHSLSRVHTVRPPLASGFADLVGSATSEIYGGLYAGNWQSTVKSYVTLKGYNDDNATWSYFQFYWTGEKDSDVVNDDTICKMYCGFKSLETAANEAKGTAKTALQVKLANGAAIMVLAMNAKKCSDTDKLSYYYDQFWSVTGLDPECGCGCADSVSGVIINSTSFYNLAVGTVTAGVTPSATITGSYPNQILNLVLPAGGGASTITPEPYVLDETIVNSSGTGLELYYTGTAGHYAVKEKNQIWKDIFPTGYAGSLAVTTDRFDAAELCPVFNAGVSGDLKIRKMHDGKLHIKGYFNCTADTHTDKIIFNIPLVLLPADVSGDAILKNLVKHYMVANAPNDNAPPISASASSLSIRKEAAATVYSLTWREPAHSAIMPATYPVGGWNVYVDDILDLTENISLV